MAVEIRQADAWAADNVQSAANLGKTCASGTFEGTARAPAGKWAMRDLNPRPRACEARALTS